MSLRMKALKSFRHPRQGRINPGEVFTVKDSDVIMLQIAKLAVLAPDETPTQKTQAEAKAVAPRKPPANPAPKGKTNTQELTSMTVAELRAVAKADGMMIKAGSNKAEILSKLRRRYQRRDMRAED